MSRKQQARKFLKIALDNKSADFRDGQWAAIEALVEKRQRLLVVQRTGWGKSIVYFLSTRLLRDAGEGPTVVISPLLALIRNQVEAAICFPVRPLPPRMTVSPQLPKPATPSRSLFWPIARRA
ncbi:MAG: DEAD/DEAH box helicase family protein [Anaerolineaceae bacterium]|nr:DEAD/DEAH box helicase family protein [Anaerolineaceae bacterium]